MKHKTASLIIIFLIAVPFLKGGSMDDRKAIIVVVEQFFAFLESRSVEDAKKILLPEGVSFSLRYPGQEGGETVVRARDFKALIESLPKIKDRYKEVMTNPKVLIHNGIAVLWAKYKFYINGKLNHTGVDAFSLVKTKDGWKVASVVYTVEPSKKEP
jgi:hypothetical protein